MSLMQRHVVQWFQGLQDAISIRQKEFLSNQDKRRASNRYGPFLCSLHPDKMAVILSQEVITQRWQAVCYVLFCCIGGDVVEWVGLGQTHNNQWVIPATKARLFLPVASSARGLGWDKHTTTNG